MNFGCLLHDEDAQSLSEHEYHCLFIVLEAMRQEQDTIVVERCAVNRTYGTRQGYVVSVTERILPEGLGDEVYDAG